MKITPTLLAAATLLVVCLVAAQNDEKKKEPQTWEEKAKARFKNNPTDDHKAKIDENLPERTAEPAKERKILVFYRCEGFIHTSIPFGNYALKRIGEETGAYSVDLSDQYDVFTAENLEQYDAIVFNNTSRLTPDESQRRAILDFISSGKGIVGLHAAADNFGEWEEGVALIGGIFDGHPWRSGGTWAFTVEDPGHPLNAAFEGDGFWHKDEIYWYKNESFQGREKLRVLLSLDMTKEKNHEPLADKKDIKDPADVDVAVSWCRTWGDGRLFYTNLGHNDMTFADEMVLSHILDGIQYALGDLEADATPSSEIDVEMAPAPLRTAQR